MINRKEVKEEAKKLLKGNVWGLFGNILLITIIFSLIGGVIGGIIGGIGAVANLTIENKVTTELFGMAVEIGEKTLFGNFVQLIGTIAGTIGTFALSYYVLNFVRGSKKKISETLSFVTGNLSKIIIASLIYVVLTNIEILTSYIPGIFGSLLTLVASIIALVATYGLTMIQPIAVDYPELKGIDIIKKSWEMMNGHKFNYFVFMFSFFGWILLCVFIVPIVYVIPYTAVAEIVYYEKLKNLK